MFATNNYILIKDLNFKTKLFIVNVCFVKLTLTYNKNKL